MIDGSNSIYSNSNVASVFNAEPQAIVKSEQQNRQSQQPPQQQEPLNQVQQNQVNTSELSNEALLQQRASAQTELAQLSTESSSSNQSALNAYTAVQNQARREEVQSLLGIDTYV